MHMADALLSPGVAVAMDLVTVTAMAVAVKKLKTESVGVERKSMKVPMMGVMGAFVFAAQMVNFVIPGTGSSGHIGGGILLAAMLGPWGGLLTIASVLIIQCLFFADGGILALGCNVFNMGVCATFVAYPLLFRPLLQKGISKKRLTVASVAAVVVGLQMGAFSVVLETTASNVTQLPFRTFLLFMQPIHLAIGIAEGLITAAVLCFVYEQRPDFLYGMGKADQGFREVQRRDGNESKGVGRSAKGLCGMLLLGAVVVAGGVSLLASGNPDGLEWAIQAVTGSPELESGTVIHQATQQMQQITSFLPDYTIPSVHSAIGTGAAGLIGGGVTLMAVVTVGGLLTVKKRK